MLRREGLVPGDSEYPRRPDGTWGSFWAVDPRQETINRNKYHGLRRASVCVINRLIAEGLEEAAEQEALKQARRFPLEHRYEVYRAGAVDARLLQLISVFPVLAVAILEAPREWNRLEAQHLVKIGAPLRRIADFMDVPMALRKVQPGVAHLAFSMLETLAQDPRLIDAHMPQPLPRMKFWLRVMRFASRINPDFAAFAAKHTTEVQAMAADADLWFEDTADWVRACLPAAGQTPRPGAEFITRRFSPDMSVKTVTALTHEWHEAVASNMTGPSYEFPEPWVEAGKVGDYEIVPITNNAELYREGHAMHHCVGTYGDRVREGYCYICSLRRKDGERVATIELVQFVGQVSLGQIRGRCNSSVPGKIELAVLKWLKSQVTFQLPTKPKRQHIFAPQENPPPRPIIVSPQNPAPRPAIAPPPAPELSEATEIAHTQYKEEWERNWSRIIPCEDFVQLLGEGQFEFLRNLREPDLVVETDHLYDSEIPFDDPDVFVDDNIDGTIDDAALVEFYEIGNKDYDADDEYDDVHHR
jgi:hypothetical protein